MSSLIKTLEELNEDIHRLFYIQAKLEGELNRKDVSLHVIDLSDTYLEELIKLVKEERHRLHNTRILITSSERFKKELEGED